MGLAYGSEIRRSGRPYPGQLPAFSLSHLEVPSSYSPLLLWPEMPDYLHLLSFGQLLAPRAEIVGA